MATLDKEKLERVRGVKIMTVLGMKDEGRKHFIRCPIVSERTPSFVIFPDGGYKCFGCGASGQNAIDLLIAMGASFIEAVSELEKYL